MDLARAWGGLRMVNRISHNGGLRWVHRTLCSDHMAEEVEFHGLDDPGRSRASVVGPTYIGRCEGPHG